MASFFTFLCLIIDILSNKRVPYFLTIFKALTLLMTAIEVTSVVFDKPNLIPNPKFSVGTYHIPIYVTFTNAMTVGTWLMDLVRLIKAHDD